MRALLLPLALAACIPTEIVAPLLPSYRDPSVPIASKADFDPARFAGRWYEIARFPVRFQEDCAGAIAEYGPPEDGALSVRNLCLDAQGRATQAIEGSARPVGPGRLRVTLEGVPFTAPYWVLWTDYGYRTAVVATPDGSAGWILNREASLPSDRRDAALQVMEFNGFDTRELLWSPKN
ncbi:lipocalin family protein [Jannaschia seohaensis]|uniref:Outer membrane lipoprotein Blc n=1 Tax=Jannaschia seohaensis TaxID=475081 RepID=A0A2Y9B4F3_9RHOB|nr:lipocalin family protein [Jannaschia seohaensis]PWJ15028.1 apolipoprotein D and lipocalin family protein [Jannaschia seohaensis]SSA49877.1 apolipoprotein D and lipocalin family protein [Jannaschia seohaensis]